MPSPRETNKRKIRQAESSNDKTMTLLMELAAFANTTNHDMAFLLDQLMTNPEFTDYGKYRNIILPILMALYFQSELENQLAIIRAQI